MTSATEPKADFGCRSARLGVPLARSVEVGTSPTESPMTQMDALKCVVEGREFHCHEPTREGQLC